MLITKEQKRLKAIKETKTWLVPVTCRCCENDYVRESVFKVNRWGINSTVHTWIFCKNCMPTKEDILNEIDTDECIFGIAFIDELAIGKKDYTRMNKIRDVMTGRE